MHGAEYIPLSLLHCAGLDDDAHPHPAPLGDRSSFFGGLYDEDRHALLDLISLQRLCTRHHTRDGRCCHSSSSTYISFEYDTALQVHLVNTRCVVSASLQVPTNASQHRSRPCRPNGRKLLLTARRVPSPRLQAPCHPPQGRYIIPPVEGIPALVGRIGPGAPTVPVLLRPAPREKVGD